MSGLLPATRRCALQAVMALGAAASLARLPSPGTEGSVRLYDASLEAGRRFAEAVRLAGGAALALEGDPIRNARSVLRTRPALIVGVSRRAEALLFAEVGAESGYARVVSFEPHGRRRVEGPCAGGWRPVVRMLENAGDGWSEALAVITTGQSAKGPIRAAVRPTCADNGRAFAWVLAPR